MKITIRRGRKIGDPGYSSTDVGLELTLECDDETYYDADGRFVTWFEAQCKVADHLLETEIRRIYAGRPAPVETAGQRDERRPEPATSRPSYQNGDGRSNGNGYHDEGDREIERARQRDEPRNGDTKPRYEWNRRGDRPPERDDRDRPRDDRGGRRDDRRGGGGRNGGGYGPPKDGRQLFALARGQEEKGANGFVKALGAWCKEHDLPWKFNDLRPAEVLDVYEAGQAMLEDQGGY